MPKKMAVVMDNFILELICLVPLVIGLFYKYHTRNYHWWKQRGVPYKEPTFPYGSLKDLFLKKTHTGKAYDDAYKEFPTEKFFGLIEGGKPTLVVKDPHLVKRILVKDFQHFVDRTPLVAVPRGVLGKNVALMSGQEWKDMRTKLTPTFTSGKMKIMFALMEKCSDQMKDYLIQFIEEKKPVDVKDVLSRFTMDIIASCAFGLDTNSLEGNSELLDKLGKVLKTNKPSVFTQMMVLFIPQWLLKLLPLVLVKPEVEMFLIRVVREAVEYREKNNVTRNDFLDLLIKMKQNRNHQKELSHRLDNNVAESLTVEQMTAQAFVFLIAGFETASSLMTFCLYELSRHQDIQEKLYQEIQEAVNQGGGKVTYQLLMDIPFLDQVINETLRLYGSVPILTRTCTQRYQLPDTNVVVEKGQRVVVPSYSFHHDPQYYPEPQLFNPGRFTPENVKERHPYVFLPFGEGPRSCIGMRFGLMQAKLGLATVIMNFCVEPAPGQDKPVKISAAANVTLPEDTVWLKFERRIAS